MFRYLIEINTFEGKRIESYDIISKALTPEYLLEIVLKAITDSEAEKIKVSITSDVYNRDWTFFVYDTGNYVLASEVSPAFEAHLNKLDTLCRHPKLRELI